MRERWGSACICLTLSRNQTLEETFFSTLERDTESNQLEGEPAIRKKDGQGRGRTLGPAELTGLSRASPGQHWPASGEQGGEEKR